MLRAGCVWLLFTVSAVQAQPLEVPQKVVYRLYQGYGWPSLFDGDMHKPPVLAQPLLDQPYRQLTRFFTPKLATLLHRENLCVKQHPGALCRLDFDPLFGAQDVAVTDLSIQSVGKDQVQVRYHAPAGGESVQIMFQLRRKAHSWRIADIHYPGQGDLSLLQVLSNK